MPNRKESLLHVEHIEKYYGSPGHILLDGQDITAITADHIAAFRRDSLGFVFQDFNLLDTLTLEENMALPLTISGVPPREIDKRVRRIAERLHISDTLKRSPGSCWRSWQILTGKWAQPF